MKNILPLIALSAVALGSSMAEPEQTPAPAPPPAEALKTTPLLSTVSALSDAECIAIANYMHRITRAAMNTWVNGGPDGQKGTIAIMKAIAAEPAEGVPDDFRRYVEEYCLLTTTSQEKGEELRRQMQGLNLDDSWDIANKISLLEKKLREDKLALSARYSRASLLGSGWETRFIEQARRDLALRAESAAVYLELHPLQDKEKPTSSDRVESYVHYLCTQPLPELTAVTARRSLERMELLKHLDPSWRLEDCLEFYGIREGATYAVRLPHDAGTGCTWKLASEPGETANYSVEWQQVSTASIKKPYPHGQNVQLATLTPSTAETAVAMLHLKKAGTAALHFICTREGDAEPLVSKYVVFYVRRVDDYRPLMETDPLPEPEPAPKFEPGVASLTDNECLAIHRYLQMVYCHTAEACAKSVEAQEHLQTPLISADVLPGSMMDAPKLPRDFHDYAVEYHNLYIRVRAATRALDRKEYNYRYGKGMTKEQRRELAQLRRQVEQQKTDMWKTLREKYPRAIILSKASAPVIIESIYKSYRNVDASAREFYSRHPEMKDATDKLSKAAFFRYLAEQRAGEEQTFEAARRHMERLDALCAMHATVGYVSPYSIYGTEGGEAESIILPLAPETGYSWQLDTPLPEDSAVQVEWLTLPSERLVRLRDLGVFERELPLSPHAAIATLRIRKAGETRLRFICTRPGDEAPLLTRQAEIKIRASEDPEDIEPAAPAPQPQADRVASLTEAECEAIVSYIRQLRTVSLHMAADAVEEEESQGEADYARMAAAELTDALPADIRDFVHAYSALTAAAQEKLAAIEQQLRELQKSEDEDMQERARPLFRQEQSIRRQFRNDLADLKGKYPRAAFLCEQIGTAAVEEALCELRNESERAQAFLKAHPKMKNGKRVTLIAYLRHRAEQIQAEASPESARDTVTKLDLHSRLAFSQNGSHRNSGLPADVSKACIFPDDRSSGYSWRLESPLPADSPVKLEWHTLPSAELLELQAIGVLPQWTSLPSSPETTIAGIRTEKAGKVTLHFIFSKDGEGTPLLSYKVTIEVRDEEDED